MVAMTSRRIAAPDGRRLIDERAGSYGTSPAYVCSRLTTTWEVAMAQQACPKCGMAKDQWKENGGQGVSQGGQTYCCSGCANGTGCTCK
jgi:hypothetical protein